MGSKYQAYPEYKDSEVEWIGCIPKNWQVTPLFGVASTESIKNESGSESNVLSLSYGNIIKRDVEENFGLLPESFNTYQMVNPGELILRLTDLQNDKRSLRVGYSKEKGIITSAYLKLIAERNKLNDRFLYRLLHSYDTTKVFYGMGGGLRQSMKFDDMRRLPILVPLLDEQLKIANFLDHETAKIDTLIEKQQQLIKLLKEKRQDVISHAVTKGLNPNAKMRDSGVEWLGEVPEHWIVCRIKQVAKLESGHTPDKKIEAYWIDCDIPWVSLNDSTKLKNIDYITETAIYLNEKGIANSSARKLPERCVVFTRDASIGLAAITTRVMAVSQHVIAWICEEKKVIPEYLLLVFYAMKDELDRYTFGATLKTIGMQDVKKLSGAFPNITEQKAIVEHVFRVKETLDVMVSKAEEAIKIIQERRTALISAAVTGKIDVRDWQVPND